MREFEHCEFRQVGTDYASADEVARYDQRMRRFRDIDAENELLCSLIPLRPESEVLEIGTGTGAFARRAAGHCRRVTALDISETMIEYAASRAREENLTNITFRKAGFLSFQAEAESFDAVVSGLALHHLSDVWKAVALRNIFRWLRPGGVFLLIDVVFDWQTEAPEEYFERILDAAPGSRENFARHIADEFSTETWIMNGLLERAGFRIELDRCDNEFLHLYRCVKP